MKQHLENLIQIALKHLQAADELFAIPAFIQIEMTKDKQHGDFASNIAMILAKTTHESPPQIAERIIQYLPSSPYIQKIEVAGPGFINFFLSAKALNEIVTQIMSEKENFGHCKLGRGKRILIEFVSSNPTGPLHIGHGRHAAFGAVIANLLDAVGFKVYREYYINDAGPQMDILTVSIWLRYLNLCGETIPFPTNAYPGDYILGIARALHSAHGPYFQVAAHNIIADLPLNEGYGGDKEIYISALVQRAKVLLAEKYYVIFDFGLKSILTDIREDLTEFGVQFDNWFSEKEFVETRAVDRFIKKMQVQGHLYKREDAILFRSTNFSDLKDRVLVLANGEPTFFANDAAYHLHKFDRGFDIAIDIFNADHHGYTDCLKAAMHALGVNPERLLYLLVQQVTLYRKGERIPMSTRLGQFVTLRELRAEVGNDAARFFYVMRKYEQHMDFDVELAKAKSNENPLYYIQYAYARICSVFNQMGERKLQFNLKQGLAYLNLLTATEERQLLNTLTHYPDIIINAALHYETHLLTHYLRDLAADFHAYYNSHQFLVDNDELRNARLVLIAAVAQTLFNGFNLLGITALKSM